MYVCKCICLRGWWEAAVQGSLARGSLWSAVMATPSGWAACYGCSRYQPLRCSWSSFPSLGYFLPECFPFRGSTQAMAIHKFLGEGGKRFEYAPFSFTALIFIFFSLFFYRFQLVWLEIGTGTHCLEVCHRFDWESWFLMFPHHFGAWPTSQFLVSQAAWKTFWFSFAARKELGKAWAVSRFWLLNYCQLQYLPTAGTISPESPCGNKS